MHILSKVFNVTVLTHWQTKFMLAVILTTILEVLEQFCRTFSADITLVLMLLAVTFIGVGLHFVVMLKTGDLTTSMLLEGIFRLPLYCLYLFLIGTIGVSVEHSMQLGLPILNLFIAYLVIGEIFTIIAYLGRMNVKVPTLLVYITSDIKSRLEGRFAAAKAARNNTENKEKKDE